MASGAQEEYDELMRDREHRTGHPEDDRHDSDDEDELGDDAVTPDGEHEDANPLPSAAARGSDPATRGTIPRTRYIANTGPKGVIADAQHFHSSRQSLSIARREAGDDTLSQRAAALSLLQRYPQTSTSSGGFLGRRPEDGGDGFDDDGDDLEDDLEDEFMLAWRQQRMRELQGDGPLRPSTGNGTRGSQRETYGGMVTVDGEGYLDAVDHSPPETVVLVYIYDDYSEVSAQIEDCLRELAALRRETRFVRLHVEDAQMEPAGVPALIAYRQGNKFAALVPLVDEMPDDAELSASVMERVLMRSVNISHFNFNPSASMSSEMGAFLPETPSSKVMLSEILVARKFVVPPDGLMCAPH